MSRDKRGNRTQEVDGSSPFSSTNPFDNLGRTLAPNKNCERLVRANHLAIFQ